MSISSTVGMLAGLTMKFTLALFWQPYELVTVNIYSPAIAIVALGMEGDCARLENPLGPVQEYELMPSGPPVSRMVLPSSTGELLEAEAVGAGLTATSTESEAVQWYS
jgi:hypothetical protein